MTEGRLRLNAPLSACAAALLLGWASAAGAQTTTPSDAAPSSTAAADTPRPVDTAASFAAASQAFMARIDALSNEIGDAIVASGADRARARVQVRAVVARYQADADAYADRIEALMAARPDAPSDASSGAPNEQAQKDAEDIAMLRGLPSAIADAALAALDEPTPDPIAAEAEASAADDPGAL